MWRLWVTFAVLTVLAQGSEAQDCHANYRRIKGHTACLKKSKNAIFVEMTDKLKQEILDRHNFHRSEVLPTPTNMMKLYWDNELEMLARKWAGACEKNAGIVHDRFRFIPAGMSVGQNLFGGSLNFTQAIDSWSEEGGQYPFGADFFHFWHNNGYGAMVLHYTQEVWALSYRIGCAAAICSRHHYPEIIVCNYGPMGNIMPFSKPYQNGTKCSGCKKGMCTKEGLCDCGDIHCNGGYINPATCQCDCTIDHRAWTFQVAPNCELKCDNSKDVWYCGHRVFSDCTRGDVNHKCPHMCGNCS